MTHGGRGGEIIAVTNLNPDGEGSFHAAIEAKGPRIIVFNSLIPVPGGEEPPPDEEPDAPPDEAPDAPPDASTDDAGADGTHDAPADVAEEEGAGDGGDGGCGCRIAV